MYSVARRRVSFKLDGQLLFSPFLGVGGGGGGGSWISLYLGHIGIECISVQLSFLQNGHAKSACVVLVANCSLCVFSSN